jgi:uncharacterized membrane protein YbhN (UPF0104 family)
VRLSPLEAHGICLLLLLADLAGRGLRIRTYTRGLGHPLRFWRAIELNAWGDAAAALTPMRVGGEAARLAGLLRAGIPAHRAFLAIGLEAVIAYPLVFGFGGWLVWRFAPDWWAHAAPALRDRMAHGWPWALGGLLLTLLVGVVAWRWRRVALREPERGIHRVRPAWHALPRWPLLVGIPTSLVNVASRTLVLPVLALSLPDHPPLGVLLVGSFMLLYSQLVLPTPAGIGAVDLALLGGAAGDLSGGAPLLLAWRFYTVGGGMLLGLALALHAFGGRPLGRTVRRFFRRPPATQSDAGPPR